MRSNEQIIADEKEKKILISSIKELLLSSSIGNFNDLSWNQVFQLKDAAAKAQKAVKSSRPRLVELRNVYSTLSTYIKRKENE